MLTIFWRTKSQVFEEIASERRHMRVKLNKKNPGTWSIVKYKSRDGRRYQISETATRYSITLGGYR